MAIKERNSRRKVNPVMRQDTIILTKYAPMLLIITHDKVRDLSSVESCREGV